MMAASAKFVSVGTRVRIKDPGAVPVWSAWDDDGQRTSTPVKKRLQKQFFSGDRRIQGRVMYVGNEAERDKMKSLGRVKVEIRDQAGSMLVITAPVDNIHAE